MGHVLVDRGSLGPQLIHDIAGHNRHLEGIDEPVAEEVVLVLGAQAISGSAADQRDVEEPRCDLCSGYLRRIGPADLAGSGCGLRCSVPGLRHLFSS